MALESLPKISPANFSPDNDLIQVYSKKGDYVGVINPSYIKTSPSGVSGAIQFSDGSAFASSSNLTWNNATNALGLGSGTTSAFIDFASNPAGSTTIVGAVRTYRDGVNLSEVMTFREDGRLTIYNTLKSIFDNYSDLGTNSERFANVYALSGRFTNVSTNTLGPLGAATWINISSSVFSLVGGQLSVRGSGSTSATTSLLVQNSSGSNALKITDDAQSFYYGTFGVTQSHFYSNNGDGARRDSDSYSIIDYLRSYGSSYLIYGFSTGNYILDVKDGFSTRVRYPLCVSTSFNIPNASAILQADSYTQGFLPPRMNDAQVRAIVSPAVGLMAYNTDLDCPVFYSAAGWRKVSHSVM